MKNKTKTLFVLVLGFFTINLGFSQITSDYDKKADFTKYKTYSFKGWEKDSDKQIPELDKKRIQDSFSKELAAVGLTPAQGEGDLAVTLYAVVDKKTSTTAYTTFNGGFGYGPRWGWGMGMGSANTTYTNDDYLEGTLIVDFYDQSNKDLVWQGVIRSVVKEKPEQREKSIPKKINKLMEKYPGKPKK